MTAAPAAAPAAAPWEPLPEDPEPPLPFPLESDLPAPLPRNWILSAVTSTLLLLAPLPSSASQVRYCRRPSTRMGSPFFL